MMRMTVILVVLTFVHLAPAVGDDAEVVAKFKEFAESENSRVRATFEAMAGKFIEEPTGMALPLLMSRKYLFSGIQMEAAPSTYSYDVRRTDSLVSPFIGTIEWPLVFIRASTHAKGPAEFCNAKPLNMCLDHGGKIVETSLLYKNSAVRLPQTVKYEYVYQDEGWKPKKSIEAVLAEVVVALETAKPLTPGSAPSILGVPPSTPAPKTP